ncbi:MULTISPECIES: alpha/beta fold hydrolase [Arthrospira]|jgi:pimeloyl-ACP methyl ester carboxylesterase|uniref:AB hydrolase-1 domain-containing protein n=1 Tax=Limnospira platensis NIES-46 TaxID=1236695 RepID=A0A5M3T2Z4_LIMPL|nr:MULTISPECIES: alpha/beta fold hydrolase [Arthrospira]KDR57545.1 alpha/beta hydrolase [Arthrospira platensis str. Paraca]MBD2668437.1 alpha/beta fold hydrolase [Arthrospira platensis FACHB-439]MBD2711414.1 alpha/beta fold hydrolase [Arthrospira platensis FACHB-835]MDF2212710.1 alpha/beta fold hydrolase [Arthrospira platensis NCB002]MDT9297112.1 alpha/beta fold hydrolase [Arthrospira platensis PCC 7345]MDT9312662.1 alpha/beta fold hydrolase [Limnospira sp. Paracas R14]QQW31704.1 alpha/beta 
MTTTTVETQTWLWKGFPICYSAAGDTGPAVVLIHGFGASWGHWRKNIPVLANQCRVFAIDLLGFGGSAKPLPCSSLSYTFETWGDQVADFCREVVGSPAFLVGNSIGCIVAMQAAVSHPEIAIAVGLLNCSLRLLHDRKRAEIAWYRSLGAAAAQKVLGLRWVSQLFFRQIATPKTVRNILLQAYRRKEAVTDELVTMLLTPANEPTAVDVFVAFTTYSQGPLPEDLLPILPCPAIILWGTEDPWEPIKLGQELAKFDTVKQFIPLEGVGHCPQDEAPELVNPILLKWVLDS